MARVYVSVGSNIDREQHVRAALDALRARFGPIAVSTVYESEAVGFDGDAFYNLVVGFDTTDDVHAVAAALDAIEDANGRRRDGPRFSSRTLDLDLLLYDELVLNEPGLQLPRDEIPRFAFVLKPLLELIPDGVHPLSGRRYADLWAEFDADSQPLRPVVLDPAAAG